MDSRNLTARAPGNDAVISLPPEFITPQDGKEKQDCETAAAKRWIDAQIPNENP